MATPPIQPTDPSQRLDLLDALRGFALAGVLLSNLVVLSLYGFLGGEGKAALATAGVDRLLDPALVALVGGKFLSMFSLLFGVGFSLQMQRTSGDVVGRRRYLRRLAALLAIGLVHAYLFWWGDILRYYAVFGLLLLPLHRLSTRALAVVGAGLIVAPPLLAHVFADAGLALATTEQADAIALAAFGSDAWPTMLRGNRFMANWWLPAHAEFAWLVAGCLLVGAALGRSGVLRDPDVHARFWRRLLVALPLGFALVFGLTLSAYGRLPWPAGWQDRDGAQLLLRVLQQAAPPILALGYMAGFVWLFGRHRWRRGLRALAPVGRMALSNYLAQTPVGLGLFYGVGLGLGPRYGLVGVGVVWVVAFAAQVGISHWWLARFRFGPAEWAWRSVTYGRRQPMRR